MRPPHRSSRNTPASWAPPTCSPPATRSRSRSRSASTTAMAAGFTFEWNTEILMTSTTTAPILPDYAPVPTTALGPALNEQGYYVGRVERNLYWITDGTYQSAFLTTSDGVVLLDAPPTIGNNIQRAIDEIAS